MKFNHSSNLLHCFDYIFVLRPMLFFPGWSTMLAGYFIKYKSTWYTLSIDSNELNYFLIIILLVGSAMLMGSAFVINQIKDIESDKRNNKLYIIADGHLTLKSTVIEVILLSLISFILSFYINFIVGLLFILFFLLTGIFYNFRPLIMKDRPWGGLIANVIMGWLAFAIGWCSSNPLNINLLIDSVPYLLFNTALYLFTTLPDITGDRFIKKETLAIRIGEKNIIKIAFFIFVIGLISASMMRDFQALTFYLLSTPFFIFTISTFEISDSIRTTKFGILFFALSVCLRWPLYIVLMIIGFYTTKLYFKKRFNLNYPNFTGA